VALVCLTLFFQLMNIQNRFLNHLFTSVSTAQNQNPGQFLPLPFPFRRQFHHQNRSSEYPLEFMSPFARP
jgi:hypothetical protein